MFETVDRDELTLLLARAFDRAWNRYYQPSRRVTIEEASAGIHLAKQIKLAKEARFEEGNLAEGGVRHLVSLTMGLL
jgi:hypothetical protein